jgi:multiple antibiotic resistance protein
LLLSWFQLTSSALGVAGGTVLFLIAIRMVFPSAGEGPFGDLSSGVPFVVPIAIPAIAGPSALATVMVLAAQHPAQRFSLWLALLAAMAVTVVTLFTSTKISRWLGASGMAAVERLMGLLLSALAV